MESRSVGSIPIGPSQPVSRQRHDGLAPLPASYIHGILRMTQAFEGMIIMRSVLPGPYPILHAYMSVTGLRPRRLGAA